MKNNRVLSLILAVIMLLSVVFPISVFADDIVLFEDEEGNFYTEDTGDFDEEIIYVEDDLYVEEADSVEEIITDNEEETQIVDEEPVLDEVVAAEAEAEAEADAVLPEETEIIDHTETELTSESAETFDAGAIVITGPSDVTALVNATATFQVSVTGGTAPYTYKWQTKLAGKTTWQDTKLNGYDTDTLSFTAISSYKNRGYRCVVTDAKGNSETSSEAFLTIETVAPLTITGPEDQTVLVNATATFQVGVTGGTAPYTYKWQTKLAGKTTWQDTKLNGYDTDTLSFTAISSYKNRGYRCVVTDAKGRTETSSEATLTIETVAPLTITGPEDQTVEVNETATFQVSVTGGTAPYTYKWQTKLAGKTTWQDTKLDGYDTDTLSFTAISSYKNRCYRCVVTDAKGRTETSGEATLTIETDIVVDGVTYAKLTDTTCCVKSYSGTAVSLTIPETVSGMTVVEIGEEAFMNNTALESIDLPDTITVIRARAFKGCTNLGSMS